MRILKCVGLFISFSALSYSYSFGQNKASTDSTYLTLGQCIKYAMEHQPALNQALIGVSIAKKTNEVNLSGWLPQVNLSGTFTHYNELPTVFQTNPINPDEPPVPVHAGITNTAIPELSATETIFSPDVLYAAKSAHLFVKQAEQSVDSSAINLVASVSKSFYNLLLTLEQINVLKEDTARLAKNLRDTYHQYVGGIADKTDYKEAAISLNNSKAQLKQQVENVLPQYAALKQLMGYPQQNQFNVSFDTLRMMQEIGYDTTQQLQFEKRIEYQQLQTIKALQQQATNYYRLQFLPTVSAFFDYNYEFESNTFSDLFSHSYPYSLVGLSVNIPLFTGFKRISNTEKSKLQQKLIDWNEVNLQSLIYTEYTSALANYKSNLYDLQTNKENVTMAKDVYNVVTLQYRQGIVPYLNVITAESNLVSSEINYINALFQLLSSKIDLQKAMGNISPNQ